jgi:Putative antitoxin of bacterial toxin-antitoxin system, YdaS/YdaT
MAVYVLRAGDTDKAKIGWAEQTVVGRVKHLQAGCWETLRILRVIEEGTLFTESWMHRHFVQFRVARDWFLFHPDMLTVVPPVEVVFPRDPGIQILKAGGHMPKTARGLGITRSAVHQWRQVPGDHLVAVEQITGIPREQLRPDLYRKPSSSGGAP